MSRPDSRARTLNIVLLILRIAIGVIMAAHGAMKLFPVFGGEGLASTIQHMSAGPHGFPPFLVVLISIGEFFGGLGMLLGFLTRFSAFWDIVIQIGAIVKVHWVNGFFLGAKPGFEYNFALISIMLALLIAGPGKYAIIRIFEMLLPKGWRKVLVFFE
jgi:putative oxidoreductase